MKTICVLLLLAIPSFARADVVLDWNSVALVAIQRTSAAPPVAARALAMMHVAIYDAVNSIEPTHQPFRVYYSESPTTSREAAAAQAAFRVLAQNFPAERAGLERALATRLAKVADGPGKTAGIRLGDNVAGEIIAWRNNDGSQRSVTHKPGTQPGEWRPTPPEFKPAMLPQWATVTPFGIEYASQFRPAFRPVLESAEYARDFEEVRTLGARDSAIRTAEQTQIAHFWADGAGTVTPPGHWNRIAQTVARSEGLTVRDNARLFALLNVALADAAVVCWDMKYSCNLWRPITAIHEADTDGNDGTTRDPDWRPLLDTPAFPTCTSGHSTFSGAAAEMLASFFGRDEIGFSNTSGPQPTRRTYASFSQAAKEAGRSRIYGGIHFEFDNETGLKSGRALAQYIFDRQLRPLSPSTDIRLAARTAYRIPPQNGRVSASGDQATGRARSEHSVVTKRSGDNPNSVTSGYAPATTTTSYSATSAETPVVVECVPNTVVYYGPTIVEYQPVVSVPSAVTYYYVSGW